LEAQLGNHQTVAPQNNQGDFSCGLVQVETGGKSASEIVVRELVVLAAIVFAILFAFYFTVGQILSFQCKEIHGEKNAHWAQCVEVALKGDSND
jgi:hypothetical protein